MGWFGDTVDWLGDHIGQPGPPSSAPPAGSTKTNDDGSKMVANADGTVTITYPDGRTETVRPQTNTVESAKSIMGVPRSIYESVKGSKPPVDPSKGAATDALNDFAKGLQDQVGQGAGAPRSTPTIGANGLQQQVISPDDPRVANDPSVKSAQTNYDYQKQQLDKISSVTRPSDPQGAAAYDAALAALNKAVTNASATLATAKQNTAASLNQQNQPTQSQSIYAPAPATYTATTVTAPQDVQVAAPIPINTNITPQQVQAHSFAAPTIANAPTIATPGAITAGTVTAERIGTIQAGAPERIAAERIARQVLDTTKTDQSRLEFANAIAMAKAAAEGNAPSAAEALLRKGIDENIGTAYGLAASLQGRNPGMALRQGAITAKDAIAKSAADMAALRADEQAKGRQLFGTLSQGMNANDIQQSGLQLGADVDVAKANASNMLEAAKSNQTAGVQTAIANLNAAVSIAEANAANALKAGEINTVNDLNAKIATMRGQIDVATANAKNAVDTNIARMNAELQTLISNQNDARMTGQINAANDLEAQIARLNVERDQALQTQRLLTETANANADRAAKANEFNATATNDASKFTATETNKINDANAQRALDVARSNQDAALRQQVIDDARAQGLRDDQIQILLAQLGLQQTSAETQNKYNAAADLAWNSMLGSTATAMSAGSGGKK